MTARILEIETCWNGLREVRQVPADGRNASLGARGGWRWRILGVPLGWVPAVGVAPLRLSPPLLTDVRYERRDDVAVDPDDLGSDHRTVWTTLQGVIEADVDKAWDPIVTRQGDTIAWDELAHTGLAHRRPGGWRLMLPQGATLTFTVGGMTVHSRAAEATAGVGLPRPDLRTGVVALATWALASVALAVMPDVTPHTDVAAVAERIERVTLHQPPPPPPPELGAPRGGDGGGGSGRAGVERPRPTPSEGVGGKQAAMNLFGALDAIADGIPSTVYANVASGPAAAAGSPIGRRGLGTRRSLGGGPGATGLGDGWGPGTSGGVGAGTEPGLGGPKVEGRITDPGAGAITMGSLSKAEIDAVMRRWMRVLRTCYQRQLQRDPTLGGTVVLDFVIATDGSVSRSRIGRDGLGNAQVSGCLAERVARFGFPAPRGGGIVTVKYPITFAPAG